MGAGSSAERKLSDDQPAEEELVLNGEDIECAEDGAPHSAKAMGNRSKNQCGVSGYCGRVPAQLKVEKGDQNAVKNMLDDAITEFFEEKKEYSILYGWDNVKLLLMVFATLTAAVSHFFKSPAISERVLIYSSVGAFFFIHALLLGYSMFVEKDTILRLSKKGDKSQVLLVRTDFPYAEENYTICMQYEGQAKKQVKVDLYIGRFFDKDGYFSKDAFVKDLEAVVLRLQKLKKQ